jgi:alcohol dehydrogenase class IV
LDELMFFEFSTANRILFGPGSLETVDQLAADLGNRVLVVTGHFSARVTPLMKLLAKKNRVVSNFCVTSEPTVSALEQGLSLARKVAAEYVIGFGGGSAIDTAKAIAALALSPGAVLDYLEVIGEGRPLQQDPLPVIAIPTTAGTGAEVTCNAVLKSVDHEVKVSLRSPLMFPRIAIVDPVLTLSLPPAVTAATGMDALTQLIEAYVSKRSNPMTESVCREGIMRSARSLKPAYHNPENLNARTDLSLASLFSGLALANSGLGAVHGIAAPLGGMCPAPHGAVCAKLLPHVIAANVKALQEKNPQSTALAKFKDVARWLTGSPSATVPELVQWLHELSRELNIPSLSTYGLGNHHLPELITRSQKASSMKSNPVTLSTTELQSILHKTID